MMFPLLQRLIYPKTPLDVAAENGNEIIVGNLLERGARPESELVIVRNIC